MNPYYSLPLGMPSLTLGSPATSLSPEEQATVAGARTNVNAPPSLDVNKLTSGPGRRERARQMADQAVDYVRGATRNLGTVIENAPIGRAGFAGGLIAPALTAIGEAQEGRPTGAAGAVAGGVGGAAIGTGIAKMIPGKLGKVAQLVLPAVGGMVGAPTGATVAESARQKLTGEPTKGKEGEFKTQLAMAQQIGELGATQYRNNMGTYTSAIIDLNKAISDQQHLELQRNYPIIEKMKNNELIRNQALLNTQGQIYSQLGVLSTAGALAQGAQAETGATLRTALQTNPYAGSTIQAPSLRFG